MALTKIKEIQPKGKTVMITGGYGHLGHAITESLAHYGAKVFVAARNKETFDATFQSSVARGGDIHFLDCDISSSKSISTAFESLEAKGIKLDGLINNAFYAKGQSPTEMSREDFNYTLDGSLASVFDCIKQSLPYLKSHSSIINVSSMYGMVAPDFEAYKDSPEFLNPPHYGAAKAGVIQLSKYYASLLGEKGIRVNTVTPGPFPSEKVQKSEGFMKVLQKRTLLNRYGLPEDLAGIFTFLMSEASSFITGQNFVIDGGWTVR